MRLRDGTTTTDPRLDRLVSYDPRSRNYPIRAVVGDRLPRSYTWNVTPRLDQRAEGACVGFAWAHELAGVPKAWTVDDSFARSLYRRAQQIDQWPGEDYEGTSVLAGAKATVEAGGLTEYRWAFSLADLVLAVGYRGPAVMGTWWWSGMFNADTDGVVRPTGQRVGGHAWALIGVRCRWPETVQVAERSWANLDLDESSGLLHNSWGADWGRGGRARVSFRDLERLLLDDGEACIPTVRLHQ